MNCFYIFLGYFCKIEYFFSFIFKYLVGLRIKFYNIFFVLISIKFFCSHDLANRFYKFILLMFYVFFLFDFFFEFFFYI